MEIFEIIVLSISALLLIYAGSSRLFNPIKSFCLNDYASNPESLLSKADVFNEMRGAGSSLALSGVAIGLGTILPQLRIASFLVAVTVFIGFALGRMVSISGDGKPNKDLMTGLFSEIILGSLNTFCLIQTLI